MKEKDKVFLRIVAHDLREIATGRAQPDHMWIATIAFRLESIADAPDDIVEVPFHGAVT